MTLLRHLRMLPIILLGFAARLPAQPCPGDVDGDGQVTVDEILVVVNAALVGCSPPATVTATVIVPPTATSLPQATPTATRTATRTRTPSPTPRFRDNGDGTITDTDTDLMWEKKSDDGGIHDKDLQLAWSFDGSQPNGAVFTTFLATLNAGRFAGHRDWRLPTRDELQTIVDLDAGNGNPTVPPEFDDDCRLGCNVQNCSCTRALNYWTATTYAQNNQQAYYVLFNDGRSGVALKTLELFARAVRDDD